MPTEAEILAYLRQVHEEHPLLTKQELAVAAWTQFAGEWETDKPAGASDTELAEQEWMNELAQRIGQQLVLLDADLSPDIAVMSARELEAESQLETALEAAIEPEPELEIEPETELEPPPASVWPALNKRIVGLTVLLAVLFAAVISGAYLLALRNKTPQPQEVTPVSILNATIPDEIGEVSFFGRRFATNPAPYEKKYQGKILEMVGLVESVSRNSDGYLEVTLVLADQRNVVYRACFRFTPEQTEPIDLARGTIAVLKGRYFAYQDGKVTLFPSVVVYNTVKPDTGH